MVRYGTVYGWLTLALRPLRSVTVSVTVYVPAAVKVWDGLEPVEVSWAPDAGSPKSQLRDRSGALPLPRVERSSNLSVRPVVEVRRNRAFGGPGRSRADPV